ncbi:unnamed protein product [Moneuplotes crassus]|uniref:Uncharacterized protein n=1 Tax=Euplotes crassus TaxID=5936 RepID=A0AAD1UEG9_EUPCR|nr:unnamed protein product [Moneuplotes crassus]
MSGKTLFNVDAPGEYSGINVSKAKSKWSFPKDSRFPKTKQSYCATAAYEIINGYGKSKGTSFGYGNRFKAKTSDSPEPGRYDSGYKYDSKKLSDPKYSFGSPGSKMDNSYLKKNIPGPGSYAPYPDFGKSDKKMSFGSRTQSLTDLRGSNPGPGSYNYQKPIGGDKGNLSYKPGMRFKENATAVPGPGSYNPGNGISSSIERAKGGKWGIDRKKDMVLRNSVKNPGPGSYKIMRDFGNY